MNRQSRRGGTKQPPKEPTYVLKRSDLEKIKEKARLEAIDTIIVMVLALPIKVLHERYGWGMRKRLPEFAEAITDEYQAFSDGEMTLEQYQQYVFDYCGLEFKKMARTFYSDFAQHCLRFYFRNTSPNFRTEASRKDWEAVDSVLNYFDSKEVDALKSVILPKEPLSDNISWYALNSDWTEDALWKLVATVEKHVATKRGLIA